MGLDITAISKAVFVRSYDGDLDDGTRAIYSPAPGMNHLDGKPEGRYLGCTLRFDGGTSFRAGSYSGYNHFRAALCRHFLACAPEVVWEEPERFDGKPFVELINFADNEGAIGPVTSKKLAADFAAHEWPADEPHYKSVYDDFRRAFEHASDDGFVIFH